MRCNCLDGNHMIGQKTLIYVTYDLQVLKQNIINNQLCIQANYVSNYDFTDMLVLTQRMLSRN